jgi:hypothetical protein
VELRDRDNDARADVPQRHNPPGHNPQGDHPQGDHPQGDHRQHRRPQGRRSLRSLVSRQAAAAALAAGVSPGHEPTERGDLYRNFGDGFTRAFELAVTPVIFGAAGYWLDGRAGIRPVLTILFTLLAVIGLLLRTWYGYAYRMQKLEESGPWASRPPVLPQAAEERV